MKVLSTNKMNCFFKFIKFRTWHNPVFKTENTIDSTTQLRQQEGHVSNTILLLIYWFILNLNLFIFNMSDPKEINEEMGI